MHVMGAPTPFSTPSTGLSRRHGMAETPSWLREILLCIRKAMLAQLEVPDVLPCSLDQTRRSSLSLAYAEPTSRMRMISINPISQVSTPTLMVNTPSSATHLMEY